MNHHMHLHKDVSGRLLTILKQDDYYRMLEDLSVIERYTMKYESLQDFFVHFSGGAYCIARC